MGTPDISATVLDYMIKGGQEISAVVTGKDKIRGRGKQLSPTPTKARALEYGIPVYTPDTLRDEAFSELLRAVNPDLIVVVAYGKILPKYVLDYPRFGCINLHVSLLPRYRGAAPMQRAIMNGEKETGVTIMYMAEGLDTGDIISQKAFSIEPEDDFEAIHDRSAEIGAELLLDTLPRIFDGTASRTVQNDAEACYAAKIEKEDCKVDFTKTASEIDCIIRGVTPIPGAFCYQNGKMLKIYKAIPVTGKGEAGRVIDLSDKGEGYFTVACGEGALKILGVIPEGKGRMSAGDYVRGRRIAKDDILE